MRFTKFGKALCTSALSAGIIFGVSSCVQSYTVGFLYVTGTVTASSGNNGIISGYKIDHNTGRLRTINTLPVTTGGSNPVRAVLTAGSRFVYVLNRGANSSGNGDCYGTDVNSCQNSNITLMLVGGNGVLTPQANQFFTQGINPFRMLVDGTGSYLLVLDHDAPDSGVTTLVNGVPTNSCTLALGPSNTTCGDITVFKIDSATGRLSLTVNAQVTAASGEPLTYFPVPANPVDFVLAGSYLLTLTGEPTPTSYPYTGGSAVWPYSYSTGGQLTLSQNGTQQLGIHQGTAIVNGSSVIYVLDNEPITVTFGGGSSGNASLVTSPSQILPFTVGTGGALQAEPSGLIPDDPSLSNPIYLLVESKGKYIYVANQGNNTPGVPPESGIAAYDLFTAPSYQLTFMGDEPFGSGSGPQCIVEDPSDQYIYEANGNDSTVTGRTLEPETGDLIDMRTTSTYKLAGPATWCFVNGRTG